MHFLGNADLAEAIEQPLETHAHFGAREWRAGAGMSAAPKPEMLFCLGPVEPKFGGAFEAARITIRRTDEDRDGGSRLDIETSNCRWNASQAEVAFDRTVDAEHLFDEIRNAIMLLT